MRSTDFSLQVQIVSFAGSDGSCNHLLNFSSGIEKYVSAAIFRAKNKTLQKSGQVAEGPV